MVVFVRNPGGEGTHYSGPWVSTATTEEVSKDFVGWASGTQALVHVSRSTALWDPVLDILVSDLLQSLTDPTVWAIHSVAELPTFIKGRAILLGDAVRSS